jgi:glutaredoxin 3
MEIEAELIELDIVPDGHAIQNELLTMTGQRTVPNVFVGGKHIGGNDDVHAAARSGELQEMLN